VKSKKPVKIIFLDFTGTIDVFDKKLPELDPLPVKETKVLQTGVKPRVIVPIRTAPRDIWTNPATPRSYGETYATPPKDTYDDYGYSGAYDYSKYPDYKGYAGGSYGKVKYKPVKIGPTAECVKYLRKLVEKTGAKIVYSSTFRFGGWKKCAEYVGIPLKHSLGHPIYGITPEIPYTPPVYPDKYDKYDKYGGRWNEKGKYVYADEEGYDDFVYVKPRQKEILLWFKSWNGKPIDNYVILDDDPITDPDLKKHWIPSIQKNGFKRKEYQRALQILSK
jgi:hypothetical protein